MSFQEALDAMKAQLPANALSMDLRDFYATMAMQAVLSTWPQGVYPNAQEALTLANKAYAMADRMIVARGTDA